MKAFLFVGIAYFLTAVLAPWPSSCEGRRVQQLPSAGWQWSLVAGILGAIGAFGTLLAFGAMGRPAEVMAIVFAGAPVVNALVSLYLARQDIDFGKVNPVFYLGMVLALVGGGLVTLYKPNPPQENRPHRWRPRAARPQKAPERVPDSAANARAVIEQQQLAALRRLIAELDPANHFYLRAGEAGLATDSRASAISPRDFPSPPRRNWSRITPRIHRTGATSRFRWSSYTRCHQTSGTSGSPMRWLDTAESGVPSPKTGWRYFAPPEWAPAIAWCSPFLSDRSWDFGSR
jgi:hypothetical protein